MMAAKPTGPLMVGAPVTTVMFVDMLRFVTGVVLHIRELAKEEQVSMEEVINHCFPALHTQKDELPAANVSCAQIGFLSGLRTGPKGCVRLTDA